MQTHVYYCPDFELNWNNVENTVCLLAPKRLYFSVYRVCVYGYFVKQQRKCRRLICSITKLTHFSKEERLPSESTFAFLNLYMYYIFKNNEKFSAIKMCTKTPVGTLYVTARARWFLRKTNYSCCRIQSITM